jgi:integrase
LGLANPLKDNYLLTMVKRGVARMKGVPPKQKDPMTVELLLALYNQVDFADNAEVAFWCALIVGFYGFLRKSSLLPASPSVPVGKRLSRVDVVNLVGDSFDLLCHHSKTLQFGQKVHTISFASCVDKRLCPVLAMLTHLGANGLGDEVPLFDYVRDGREVFFSHSAFVSRLKAGVRACGRDSDVISCHSLRRGGATLSFACGLSNDQIKLRGDWASDCDQQYIVVSRAAGLEVAQTISLGVAVNAGMYTT